MPIIINRSTGMKFRGRKNCRYGIRAHFGHWLFCSLTEQKRFVYKEWQRAVCISLSESEWNRYKRYVVLTEYSLAKKAYAIASTDCELQSVISVVRFVSGTEPNTIHKIWFSFVWDAEAMAA